MTVYCSQMPRMRYHPRMSRWMDAELRESFGELFIPVDVKAEDEAYVLSATIPGVSAQDLNIQVVNETVTIQGEIQVERIDEDHYLLSERPSGRFNRVITLPDALDAGKAEAHIENGVLTLRIPKSEEAKPKTIKINAK